MKLFVDALHMSVIAVLIYPMFYLWDTSQVDQFCQGIETGMSKQDYMQLADENLVKVVAPQDGRRGRWESSVIARSPFTDYSCEVVGLGNRVSRAWIES